MTKNATESSLFHPFHAVLSLPRSRGLPLLSIAPKRGRLFQKRRLESDAAFPGEKLVKSTLSRWYLLDLWDCNFRQEIENHKLSRDFLDLLRGNSCNVFLKYNVRFYFFLPKCVTISRIRSFFKINFSISSFIPRFSLFLLRPRQDLLSEFHCFPHAFCRSFFFHVIFLWVSISGLYFGQMFVGYNVFYTLASFGLSAALYPPRYKRLG